MLESLPSGTVYDAVILAVAHKEFNYPMVKQLCGESCVLFDVKGLLDKNLTDARL